MERPAPRIGRARIFWPERPWGDPGGATEPSRVEFGRSSRPIEPLRAPKVARGGRSRRPRSRSGSILARSGSILARKSCSKRLHRQGRRRSHFEADFWWLFRRFCALLPRSRFLANIAGTLRFVVRDVQSQCSSRLLSMRVSHDDRARIASRFGYQNLTKIVPKTAWNELPERNWPPKRFGGAFGSIPLCVAHTADFVLSSSRVLSSMFLFVRPSVCQCFHSRGVKPAYRPGRPIGRLRDAA